MKAWVSIFDVLAPNLIILDFSPTARLAAGKKYKTAVVGSPFTIPPIGQNNLPRYQTWPSTIFRGKFDGEHSHSSN